MIEVWFVGTDAIYIFYRTRTSCLTATPLLLNPHHPVRMPRRTLTLNEAVLNERIEILNKSATECPPMRQVFETASGILVLIRASVLGLFLRVGSLVAQLG